MLCFVEDCVRGAVVDALFGWVHADGQILGCGRERGLMVAMRQKSSFVSVLSGLMGKSMVASPLPPRAGLCEEYFSTVLRDVAGNGAVATVYGQRRGGGQCAVVGQGDQLT